MSEYYKGNSVQHWYAKTTAYSKVLDDLWEIVGNPGKDIRDIVKELKQAQTNAQQTHGEICPHWKIFNKGGSGEFGSCQCSGKLSPC